MSTKSVTQRTCHTRDFSKGTERDLYKTPRVEYISSTDCLPVSRLNPESIQSRAIDYKVPLSNSTFKKQTSRDDIMYRNAFADNIKLEKDKEQREKFVLERKLNRSKHRSEFSKLQRFNRKQARDNLQSDRFFRDGRLLDLSLSDRIRTTFTSNREMINVL